jgi:isopenicillin N synthase-like dioxygenase
VAANVEVPVVSIDRRPGRGAPSAEVVDAVAGACERIGFFVVTDHGVDVSLMNEMRNVSQAFFDQPQEVKSRFSSDPPNRYRGYASSLLGGIGYADSASGGKLDYVESYEVCPWDSPEEMRLAGYDGADLVEDQFNVWPNRPSKFRSVWRRYFAELASLSDEVLSIFALALDLPSGWFADKFSRRPSHLAVNFYPGQEGRPPDAGQLRQKAHTDIGAVTLLLQTDVGGLQVLNRDEDWINVPVLPDTFVVNLGDLLAKWTNDRWVATPHRVLNPAVERRHEPRISIPFFDRPNLDATIECIPTCRGDGPRYEPVRAAEWVQYRQSMYGQKLKG